MSKYNGVFNKSIEVSVIAKQSAPVKDSESAQAHSIVFFNNTNDIQNVAYAVEVTAGISIPFTLKLTVLSSLKPSRSELKNDLLFSNYTVSLKQDNEGHEALTGRVKRLRKFKGIVTSYAFKGSIPSAQDSAHSCYVYELTIEPKLVLLSLKKRTCHYSGLTVIDIIKELFKKHDLQAYCEIDLNNFGEDKFDDTSFVFEQNHETDLEFLNRLCRQFSINYCFDDNDDDYKVTFSRLSTVYSHFPVITQSDNTENTVVSAIVNPNIELKSGESSYIFNAFYKGSSLEGSIYSEENDAELSDDVESNLNTDIAGNSKQLYYIRESHNKIRNILDEYLVLKASDLMFSSGVHFLLKDDNSCFNNCECLTVREYLKFNVSYPSYFAGSDSFNKEESELTQKFVAIPIDNSENAVLGPLCVFKKLEDVEQKLGHDLDACFGLTKVNQIQSHNRNQTVTVTGTVCNVKGETADDNEVNRIALESNQSNYDKFYVKVSGNDKDPSVVICNYLKSYLGVNNLPKLGQKVVMLFTGCKYYLLGILPKEVVGLTDESIQNKNADSVLIKNNDGSSAISLGAMTDIKSAIREKLLSHELSSYVGLLNIQNNSLLPKENFETESVQISYKKAALSSDDEDTVVLENVNQQKTFKAWAEILPNEIKSVEALQADIAKKINTYELQNDSENADKELKFYNLCKESLTSLVEATKEYSTRLEEELHNYIATNKSALAIKSKGSVKLSSTPYDQDSSNSANDESSYVDVSSAKGISIKSSKTLTSSGTTGKVNVLADDTVTINAGNKIILNVANSTIVIDASGIKLTSKKFAQDSVLWDSAIVVDSMGNLKLSAFDTVINSFSSNTISDSFGGRLSTMAGKVLAKGSFVNVATQKSSEVADCLVGLTTVLTKWGASVIKELGDFDSSSDEATTVNRMNLLYSDSVSLYSTIRSLIRNFGATLYASNNAQMKGFLFACIVNVLKIVDVLEDIVITSIDLTERKTQDETWEKRDKSNNYISNRDKFKLVTSSLSKTAFVISSMPALLGALKATKSSSLVMSGGDIRFVAPSNVSFAEDFKAATAVTAGESIAPKGKNDNKTDGNVDEKAGDGNDKPKTEGNDKVEDNDEVVNNSNDENIKTNQQNTNNQEVPKIEEPQNKFEASVPETNESSQQVQAPAKEEVKKEGDS